MSLGCHPFSSCPFFCCFRFAAAHPSHLAIFSHLYILYSAALPHFFLLLPHRTCVVPHCGVLRSPHYYPILFFYFSVPASGGLPTLAPSSRFPHFFARAWEQHFFFATFAFVFLLVCFLACPFGGYSVIANAGSVTLICSCTISTTTCWG